MDLFFHFLINHGSDFPWDEFKTSLLPNSLLAFFPCLLFPVLWLRVEYELV